MTDTPQTKPILCLDFDGVLHSYESGWKGADVIPDPPVPGAMAFLIEAVEHFEVHIYSSRSGQAGGIAAMQIWLLAVAHDAGVEHASDFVYATIKWPIEKPPAMVTLDDRAVTFNGTWPHVQALLGFEPWNKKTRECRIRWCRAAVYEHHLVTVHENLGDGTWNLGICPSCADKLGLKDGDELPGFEVVKAAIEGTNTDTP